MRTDAQGRGDAAGLHGRVRRWRRAIAWADLALFERAAQRGARLDRSLLRVTRLADRSVLWITIAAALAALGRGRERSAAIRGLAALSIASTVANLPVKLGARRHRPPIDRVPLARRLARAPRTFSFPSGHTASAAAFTTGVALERPLLAAPIGILAAAVGYSRVHVGVHYPSDVLAGAALGAGAGVLTLRPWPRERPVRRPAHRTTAAEPAAPLVIVANVDAGPEDDVPDLAEAFPAAEIRPIDADADLRGALEDAARSAGVLGVAGGDGTIGTAADAAAHAGCPLLVIPTGTRNHFALDLGIGDVRDAAAALEEGQTTRVDLAAADGATFVNTLTLGAYARLVDLRERLSPEVGDFPARVVATVRALRETEPVEIEVDGVRHRVWLAFVGNGRYASRGLGTARRERLDGGVLDVRLLHADRPWSRTRSVAAMLLGRPDATPVLERRLVERLRIRFIAGYPRLARDGETTDVPERLEVRTRPGAFTAFVRPPRTG